MLGSAALSPAQQQQRESERQREKQNPSFAVQPCPPYPFHLGSFWLNMSEVLWPRSERVIGEHGSPVKGGWDDRHGEKRQNIVGSVKKQLKKDK